MNNETISTLLISSTVIGRIYGQGSDYVCLFDVQVDDQGNPVIKVRTRHPEVQEHVMPPETWMLVQLFENPDALWLANAVLLSGVTPVICYAPIHKLVSADGRVVLPKLVDVSLELVGEATHDAMSDRDRPA